MRNGYVVRVLCPAAVFLLACAETSTVEPPAESALRVGSSAQASVAGDGTVPTYPTEADVPSRFWQPLITDKIIGLSWVGSTVTAGSTLYYYGNRGGGTFNLTVSGIDNPPPRSVQSFEEQFWPEDKVFFTDDFGLTGRSTCGNTATLDSQHTASITFDIGSVMGVAIRITKSVTQPGNTTASQDACGERTSIEPAAPGSGGGGDDCITCLLPPVTECAVLYHYDIQTGEIMDYSILYCY
jgi:hypothetical protein